MNSNSTLIISYVRTNQVIKSPTETEIDHSLYIYIYIYIYIYTYTYTYTYTMLMRWLQHTCNASK